MKICDIEWEDLPEGIQYTLLKCEPDDIETNIDQPEIIDHYDLAEWLRGKEYLDKMPYTEFVVYELNKEVIHEYLMENDITNLSYAPELL
jgi:hypothetical protein